MCGICGFYQHKIEAGQPILEQMNDQIVQLVLTTLDSALKCGVLMSCWKVTARMMTNLPWSVFQSSRAMMDLGTCVRISDGAYGSS